MFFEILNMRDNISCLILLDLYHNTSCIKQDDETKEFLLNFQNSFTEISLMNEDWLLAYESIHQGWIKRNDLIDKNIFLQY